MAQGSEPVSARKKTVLLVDDESAIALLFEMELTRMGYFVLKALSGAEASKISLNYHSPIDVLVTDWNMPDMNGDDLACELLVQRPDIKVILMSGFPEADAIAKAFPEDQLVFLSKPLSPAKLDETIRKMLKLPGTSGKKVA